MAVSSKSNGRRIAFADLQSQHGSHQMLVTQHQISRTGVMFRSGFQNDADLQITPVNLPPSQWNPLANRNTRGASYLFQGDNFGGDFFSQPKGAGYHLRAVRSTRSRIEWKNAQQPEAVPVCVLRDLRVDVAG